MQAAMQTDNDWEAPHGSGPVHATIRLPGSKSMTNRALVIAALAAGPTTIAGPLQARDTELMAAAVAALGAPGARDSTATDSAARDGAARDGAARGGAERDGTTWTVVPGWTGEPASVNVGN